MEVGITEKGKKTNEWEVYEDEEGGAYTEGYKNCKKSNHANYIPSLEFSKNHLPDSYQDDDIVRLVKVMAGLTVKLEIFRTSEERPKINIATHGENPSSDGCLGVRIGTGRVQDVKLVTTTTSDKPPQKIWEIKIFTANHVVFDDLEAKCVRCYLKYDSDETIRIRLQGREVKEADIPNDWCCFKCETSDTNLANELHELLGQCMEVCKQLSDKYPRLLKDILTIIVAHPHGGPKMVSVGRSLSREELEWPDETKYTYDTTTCRGSSGAFVYLLGRTASCGLSYHVHSGYIEGKGNYCSVGWDF